MNVFPVYYFPPISWFVAAAQEEVLLLEANEFYKKQQYFNRMRVMTSNKVLDLSIPIKKAKETTIITEREIHYDGKWVHDHWVSLTSAYRSSPYFEYYEDHFEPFFKNKDTHIFERNLAIIKMVLGLLQLDVEVKLTEEFHKTEHYDVDYRRLISPKSTTSESWFDPQPYLHVFGESFHPDLSIFDLLCNQGPASSLYLKQCWKPS